MDRVAKTYRKQIEAVSASHINANRYQRPHLRQVGDDIRNQQKGYGFFTFFDIEMQQKLPYRTTQQQRKPWKPDICSMQKQYNGRNYHKTAISSSMYKVYFSSPTTTRKLDSLEQMKRYIPAVLLRRPLSGGTYLLEAFRPRRQIPLRRTGRSFGNCSRCRLPAAGNV